MMNYTLIVTATLQMLTDLGIGIVLADMLGIIQCNQMV
jgi:hypothetical protein